MKLKLVRRAFAFLAAVLLALSACDMGNSPDPEPEHNDPDNGLMTRASAEKIFGSNGIKENPESVEIHKFRDVDALKAYLEGSDTVRRARLSKDESAIVPAAPVFTMSRINGKPVTRILPGAFKPDVPGGKDDISTLTAVLNPNPGQDAPALPALVIVLPETLDLDIEDLGGGLFEGVSAPITVDIPMPVIERVLEKEIEKQVVAAAAREGVTLTEAEKEDRKEALKQELADAPQGSLAEDLTKKLTDTLKEAVGKGAGEGAAIEVVPVAPPSSAPANPDAPVVPPLLEPGKPISVDPTPAPPVTPPSNPTPPVQQPPSVTIHAISGLTPPAHDGTPVSTIEGNAQYTGVVVWSTGGTLLGSGDKFTVGKEYTAVITLMVESRYSLSGIGANFFTVAEASSVTAAIGSANTVVVTAVFPLVTVDFSLVTPLVGLVPAFGGSAKTVLTTATEYESAIAWEADGTPWTAGTFVTDVSYRATITITPKTGYVLTNGGVISVDGAVSNVIFADGTGAEITAVFPVLANVPTSLGDAIKAAKDSSHPVVQLTTGFYSTANSGTAYITVDGGDTDNPTPYTIRGLGKNSTALSVGILLANDHITLEQVKINITAAAAGIAAPCSWETYNAGISIGRANSGGTLLTLENLSSNNVTVKDCEVTVTGAAGFTAGIYICGTSTTGGGVYASQNITLSGNSVKATGNGGSAVQALNIAIWHSSVAITGNTFEARYGERGTIKNYYDRPASAIFMSRVFGSDMRGTQTPAISGNTLKSSVYSFYFNAFQVASVTDQKGIDILRNDNFAVAETTWALSSPSSKDTSSTYKLLFDALLKNNTFDKGKGFAYVSSPTYYASPGAVYFNIEQYEIESGAVKAISVFGDHIADGEYKGGSGANKFANSGTGGWDYGRKLASAPTTYNDTDNNKFCYGFDDDTGNVYDYDTDFNP
jgi:hypothetical protein